MTVKNILQVNSSGRYEGSITRKVSDLILTHLMETNPQNQHITRDVATGLPFINEAWINANFIAADQRNDRQKETLGLSDLLVNELQEATHLVISAPLYNFGIPATLKAWVDLIARVQLTFHYNEEGKPVGLLKNKKAIVVMASGGVPLGSDWDKSTPYMKHLLSFIGINDVVFINATEIDDNPDKALNQLANLLV